MTSDHTPGLKRRSVLLTVAALGAFVCLIGGTVLYSALQDTARTGTNSAESGALAGSADIQIATATRTGTTITCGTFSEDLTSALFTLTGVSAGFISSPEHFCIRSVGSQPVTLSALADELADIDVACTGDEELLGDTTCGGNQLGELSSVLTARYVRSDCQAFGPATDGGGINLKGNATNPVALGSLAPSATACFEAALFYDASSAAADQTAQSDRSTWRYKFTAQV